jgi:hypothetical protein
VFALDDVAGIADFIALSLGLVGTGPPAPAGMPTN